MQTNIQPTPDRPPTNGGSTAPARSRMALTNIVKGRIQSPITVLLYGTEGVGKTTWASRAPAPVFIAVEDGTDELDVAGWRGERKPQSWEDVLEALRVLETDPHDFKSVVIDTLDALEGLCWEYTCRLSNGKAATIEDFGYGKGYNYALEQWRVFLATLERLKKKRSLNVILLAHAWVKTFKNPEGEDFDRYMLKVHDKAGGLIKEWCGAVLFTKYETHAVKKDPKSKAEKAKGVSTGARIVHTQRTAAWDAKNRYGLPSEMPLNWDDFAAAAAAHKPDEPAKLKAEIEEIAALVEDDAVTKWVKDQLALPLSAEALAMIKDRLNAKIAQTQKGGE